MPKIVRYATEEAILTSVPGRKLNFGNNIYLHLNKSEKREGTFRLRVFVNGMDTTYTIGKYPELNLEEAKRIAALRMAEVAKVRGDSALGRFRKALQSKSRATGGLARRDASEVASKGNVHGDVSPVGFRNLEDLGRFVAGLVQHKNSMHPELYYWLRLALWVPSTPDELLNAMWIDIDVGSACWKKKATKASRGSNGFNSRAMLSTGVLRGLETLRGITGTQRYLFPILRGMRPTARKLALREALRLVWPHYHVAPEDFGPFFDWCAKRYSLFHPSLIDQVIAHRAFDPALYNHGTVEFQARALSEWWSQSIDWFAFGESPLRWGGDWSPMRLDEGRPKWQRTM